MLASPPDSARALFAPEHAHPEAPIEWWFVHGHYDGADSGRRYFMTSLFRVGSRSAINGSVDGFQLLVAVLDPGRLSDGHTSAAWIDRPLLDQAIGRLKAVELGIDPLIREALLREIETHGPPHPILLLDRPSEYSPVPFGIRWSGFSLSQDDTGFDLHFLEPEANHTVALHLEPAAPGMDIPGPADLPRLQQAMRYRSYPRVRLSGSIDSSERVSGTAWVDHQWGQTGWFLHPEDNTLLGWDWFGIGLDDGSDLLVTRHRDARTGAPLAAHATLRQPGGLPRTAQDVRLTPVRFWESPSTLVAYPVAWRIEVHTLGVSLTFEPRCENQEVMSFGPARAVWEGAGAVSGTVQGAQASGSARGEFHGYGYVFDSRDVVARAARQVDVRLERLLPRQFDDAGADELAGPARWRHDVDAYTKTVSAPAWDLLDRGGKRWRPLFATLLLECLGVASGPYDDLLASLELLHAGSLIIDDIEDDSSLRRGQPSIHVRHGVDVAINAANLLYFLPSVVIRRHPRLTGEQRRRWLEIKDQCCLESHFGQATDICWARSLTKPLLDRLLADGADARILQSYALKTGAATAAVAEMVTVIAEPADATAMACVDFARSFGVAYQIADDVQGFSRAETWTKTSGEDLANGKLTYVIASALRSLPRPGRERLTAILCSPELRSRSEVVEEGATLIREADALVASLAFASSMHDGAWDVLSPHLRPSEPKILLRALCQTLIDGGRHA